MGGMKPCPPPEAGTIIHPLESSVQKDHKVIEKSGEVGTELTYNLLWKI